MHQESRSGAHVRLSGVWKGFEEGGRERSVLRGVEASFEAGEFAVLLGRSGSGKSTLLNVISGLELPDRGTVEIDGEPLSELSDERRTLWRRHQIGFVFQAFNLVPTLTVLENVLLPLELKGEVGAAERERSHHLLDRVGLSDRSESYPDVLSGGEQQRLAIARALSHRPTLILADEPTGNLDLETGRAVLGLLESLVREEGRTLIMVTHAREVMGHADRALQLQKGVVSEVESEPDA